MIIDKQKWAILVCNQCKDGMISDESCMLITRYPKLMNGCPCKVKDGDMANFIDVTDRVKILIDRIEILDSENEK